MKLLLLLSHTAALWQMFWLDVLQQQLQSVIANGPVYLARHTDSQCSSSAVLLKFTSNMRSSPRLLSVRRCPVLPLRRKVK